MTFKNAQLTAYAVIKENTLFDAVCIKWKQTKVQNTLYLVLDNDIEFKLNYWTIVLTNAAHNK